MIALLSTATEVYAQGCEPRVATLVSAQGAVEIERLGQPRWQAVAQDDLLCPGDRIRVGPLGRAAVRLADEAETQVRLDERTLLTFPAPQAEKPLLLKLIEGVLHVLSRIPHTLTIETPLISAGVEGTEFVLGVSKRKAELWVFEGRVRYWNAQGQLQVASGEGAIARPGQAPVRRVVVRPREAVEWALYYPPLVDLRPESYPPALRGAVSAYRDNDLPAAFTLLERVPAGERDGRYFILRAGLLLSVGRVPQAEADLTAAEQADPKAGGPAALRSVIALVRDRKDEALQLAEKSAGLEPDSPLPQAALSYAYQGLFEIEKAFEHARRAVELRPEDALLRARVSELELSRGDLDAALEAAEQAEALSPALPRTQTVLGYAYLTRIEIEKAKSAFERALRGDPADPLPRLGLGLARIRDGDLEAGRRDIETAASLDPDNSLVRSYLGKAYYEEERDGLAAGEYERAKLLDPKDPTPWFYDAIRKQTTNRPVEALHDLQRAIELNGNRAVYRSKLLLDQDLAARSAALGRIYRDLGFDRLALVQGWKSLNTDPSNYSAHRLLADSYGVLPRHEVARVSELLQSQLLQPLNITPVQPRLAESEPLILDSSGLAGPSFNEFNPLFTRDRIAFQSSAIGGNNSTYGDEVTLSGVWNQYSYSLGQLHYVTDGFRDNNDLVQDIYDAFVQVRLSPTLDLQAEYRHREAEHGDLNLFFDPADIRSNFRRTLRTDVVRLGAHLALAPHSDVIASVVHLDEVDNINDSDPVDTANRGYLGEAQYLLRTHKIDLITGIGHYNGDQEDTRPIFGHADVRHTNGYFYSYWRYPDTITWTLGMSIDALNDASIRKRDLNKLNPKLGISWDITPSTTMRLAAFSVLKRSLLNDQTIEPTQIAGFNQFFDDVNGTRSTRYGVGLDHKFSDSLYGGLEASRRELEVPVGRIAQNAILGDDWEEQTYRAYGNWTPYPWLALNAQYELEKFGRDIEDIVSNPVPRTVTHTAPISLRFFDTGGFFVNLISTYVNQEVDFFSEAFSGEDDFWIVDIGIGYRLPKRYGIVRLGANNLFDEEFLYQGMNFRTVHDDAPTFMPDRSYFLEVTLAF